MARNVEIKAQLSDPSAMRSRVPSLGATGPEELVQTDTFFSVPVGRLKLREFGDGTGEPIFYERPDAVGPKLSDYHRAPAQEPDALREALARSLGVRATVRKQRAIFLLGQTRIHLDDVDGLGSFIRGRPAGRATCIRGRADCGEPDGRAVGVASRLDPARLRRFACGIGRKPTLWIVMDTIAEFERRAPDPWAALDMIES
jgi:hypothetical protein